MRFQRLDLNLERGYVDLLVTVDFAISSDHPSELMFQDDYVVAGDRDNPAMAQPMTLEHCLSLGHVTVRFTRSRIPAFDDWFMRRKKQQRRIGTMHRRLAEKLGRRYPLAFTEVPFEIPPIRELAQWDIANNNDAALRWVVSELCKVAAEDDPRVFAEHAGASTIAFEFQGEQGLL